MIVYVWTSEEKAGDRFVEREGPDESENFGWLLDPLELLQRQGPG